MGVSSKRPENRLQRQRNADTGIARQSVGRDCCRMACQRHCQFPVLTLLPHHKILPAAGVEERERMSGAASSAPECIRVSCEKSSGGAGAVEHRQCTTPAVVATERRRARNTRATLIADERHSRAANSIRVIKFSNTRLRCHTAVRFGTIRSCFSFLIHVSVVQRQYIIARAAFVGGLCAISRVNFG